MKAVVCTRYGPPDVLQLKEVETPTPRNNEVCIKIFATAVTATDCIIRGFKLPMNGTAEGGGRLVRWHPMGLTMGLMLGFRKPRQPILGLVLAGDIESVGKEVKRFRTGDQVYGFTGLGFGTYAEYTCMPEAESAQRALGLKPVNVPYEEAAAVPYGGLFALHYLKKGDIQSGQKVLIYGASGAIGTSAVQLAKYFGATVTGVCSTTNVGLVTSLGADTVIDYTKEASMRRGERYDLVLDAVGQRKTSQLKVQCKTALTQNGKYVSVDDGRPNGERSLIALKEIVEAGRVKPILS